MASSSSVFAEVFLLQPPTSEGPERNEASRRNGPLESQAELRPPAVAGARGRFQSRPAPGPQRIASLQSSIGNQAVLRMMRGSGPAIQPKLAVNAPGDQYEQEADRVAAQVMCTPDSASETAGSPKSAAEPHIRRECKECEEEEGKEHPKLTKQEEEQSTVRRSAIDGAQMDGSAPQLNESALSSGGEPLPSGTRNFYEPRFGHDFSAVRIHTGPASASLNQSLAANAFAFKNHVWMGRDETAKPSLTLAHELAHVVQQGGSVEAHDTAPASPKTPAISERSTGQMARQATIDIELMTSLDSYRLPGTNVTYSVGDSAASRVLMDIVEIGPRVSFKVFNFETGAAQEMSPTEWDFFKGAAVIGGSNAGIAKLGRQLSPSQWRALWPNPTQELLKRYEAGQLQLDDEAVLTGYHGMIRTEASQSLDRNEKTIDELLSAPDRVQRIKEYATGLREASIVRDQMIRRRDELSQRLVAQHSFTFGLPHAGTGPDTFQQLTIQKARAQVDQALEFWVHDAFPLLSRFQTNEINPASIDAKLQEIKANIVGVRRELDQGRVDPMTLDVPRARIAPSLGQRTTAVVAAEDKSRSNWSLFMSVAMTAGTIGILFLPGGAFIDAAIGIAIAGSEITRAQELGHEADTALHVDDGLVSQAQVKAAQFAAALTTALAIVGAVGAGFRVLRIGLALRTLNELMPDLAQAERGLIARAIVQRKLILAPGRVLSPAETEMATMLLREGRTVQTLAESADRTSDFIVDGVRTELKTISNITSPDISGALGRRILEGAGQAPHIIADVRNQPGMTLDLAARAMRRAYGADKLNRVLQIRIIGSGFDQTWPRLP